jgi:hypothetical protein
MWNYTEQETGVPMRRVVGVGWSDVQVARRWVESRGWLVLALVHANRTQARAHQQTCQPRGVQHASLTWPHVGSCGLVRGALEWECETGCEETKCQDPPLHGELSPLLDTWGLVDELGQPSGRELAGADLDVAAAKAVTTLAAGVAAGQSRPEGRTAGQHSRTQQSMITQHSITRGGVAACWQSSCCY